MNARVIPLLPEPPRIMPWSGPMPERLTDRRDRPLQDLRISVTDRCNFRCTYCMPREIFDGNYPYLPRSSLLTFEEIRRLAGIFVAMGVRKIRLTGGEPLLRRGLEELVAALSALGVELALTTNGILLPQKARALRAAGLHRLTISLDALDHATFLRMSDADYGVEQVLQGIAAAEEAGFDRLKINCVVKRGCNEDDILPLARHFRGTRHILRFIEFMDVGTSNGWRLDDVVPSAEVLRRIGEHFPIAPLDANYPGEVAQRWHYLDGQGEIGVISSVTRAFCDSCSRIRLSTDGSLYTCLFAAQGHDLRSLLRAGADDEALQRLIAGVWQQRDDNYSQRRHAATGELRRIEMSYIGG